jgi:hypothetical protein
LKHRIALDTISCAHRAAPSKSLLVTRPLDLRAELDALTRSLDAAGIPYAVCGALALAIHGHPRATKDIDLLIPPDKIAAAKAVARVHGFTIEALPMVFSSSGITVHRTSRLLGTQILTLDLLEAAGPLAPVWDARERHATAHGSIWVVSRQGLVTMKLAAGRPQDLADLAKLEVE